jgi:hypothetical protein
MTDKRRSSGQEILTWLQIVAICGAAFWTAWTFYFKEYFIPKTTPVNISLDLALEKVGPASSRQNSSLVAIEMKVSAANPSSREVWLLPSAWCVYGIKIKRSEPRDSRYISQIVSRLGTQGRMRPVGQYFDVETEELTAFGQLYDDAVLRPGEKIKRSLIFYVPKNRYDEIRAQAMIPTAAHTDELVFKWKLKEKDQSLDWDLYRRSSGSGSLELLPEDTKNRLNPYPRKYEWQWAEAAANLSLWH